VGSGQFCERVLQTAMREEKRVVVYICSILAMGERVCFLLVDGIGDVTIPAFGDRTPLEVAHVPFLDAIAGAAE